jgi:hypothetical protein
MPSDPTPVELETLLDMAGFFGAQTGALATGIAVVAPDHLDQVQERDLVLIGTPESEPLISKWANKMPLDLSVQGMRVNQVAEWTLLFHPEWPFRSYDSERLAHLLNDKIASVNLFVESFVSPLRPDRVVVAITPSGASAIGAVRALFTPSERQGPVYGGVAISRNGRFQSFLVGTRAYHAGELNDYQFVTVFLFENYRLIPLVVLFLSVVIVAWVRWSTERVAARRLAT